MHMKKNMLAKVSAVALVAAFAATPQDAHAQTLDMSAYPAPKTDYDPMELQTTIGDNFTYAVVGDIITPLPTTGYPDPAYQAALKIVKDADAAYANFEMTALNIDKFQGVYIGGFHGVPEIADEIKRMGFDAVGRASNHQYDFGADGALESNDLLRKAGVVIAGSGKNYGAARAPRYLMTKKGRMAFVAGATSQPFVTGGGPAVRASLPNGEMPGRSGVFTLDVQGTFVVPRSMQSALEAVKKALPAGGALYAPANDTPERFTVMGKRFTYGDVDKPQFTYKVSEADVKAFQHSITEGKMKSDFLSFGLHSHETHYAQKPDTDPLPGDFMQDFAHKIIDAGADAFVGTGVHVLRGIEIYKNRPIYYGLAEFIRQMDINRLGSSLPERGEVNSDPKKYETVIAVNRYVGGQLSEIRLYPVQLGGELRMAQRGLPRVASPEIAQNILKRLQDLSTPYGTKIAIENNIGIIRVASAKK
jgi:poly-gamma-glutamate capsule biosynthesis protein CapA/YwtB (metallophosphatase superfamily)